MIKNFYQFRRKNIQMKHFSFKIYHQEIVNKFIKIHNFKSFFHELLENKIFHFAILDHDVKELVCLQKQTQMHKEIIQNFSNQYKFDLSNSISHVSSKVVMLSTLPLTYHQFLDFIRISHENNEEETNNLIRIMVEQNMFDQENDSMKKFLKNLRDDWRNCLNPEVLNENKLPLTEKFIISQIAISLNNNMLKLIL